METQEAVHRYPVGARQRRSLGSFDRVRPVDLLTPSTQEAIDRITSFAGEALEVPAVCTALVDAEHRLLTSSYGLPVPTALILSHAFWRHVVTRRPLVIADGRRDPLVARNPAVRDGTVRACVGIPLRTAKRQAVGTLLVVDQKPRQWTGPQLDLLQNLSALIVGEVELRGAVRRASHGDASSLSVPVM